MWVSFFLVGCTFRQRNESSCTLSAWQWFFKFWNYGWLTYFSRKRQIFLLKKINRKVCLIQSHLGTDNCWDSVMPWVCSVIDHEWHSECAFHRKFNSSSIATRFCSDTACAYGAFCCFTFPAILEKNETTGWVVKNSETLNKRSPFNPFVLPIFVATISASSFLSLSCPMLNLAVRYSRCFSLNR